jgi:hypothetical protein
MPTEHCAGTRVALPCIPAQEMINVTVRSVLITSADSAPSISCAVRVGVRTECGIVSSIIQVNHANVVPVSQWVALRDGRPVQFRILPAEDGRRAAMVPMPPWVPIGTSGNSSRICEADGVDIESDGTHVIMSANGLAGHVRIRMPLATCSAAFAKICRDVASTPTACVVAGLESKVVAGAVAGTAAANAAGDDTKKGGANGGRPPGRWARLATWRLARK